MKKKKRLIYVPLGGAGEIGMNMYLYGYGFPGKELLILIDVGVTFPDMNTTPGVDLIMPDIDFVEKNKDRLLGIFITHAHEDHIGALGHLFDRLCAPIYCREFTAQIAFSKLSKVGNDGKEVSIVKGFPDSVVLDPFKISFIPISHSIPEASSLLIETPVGCIVHTGDFKIDKTPVLGDPFNQELLLEIKKQNILALMCDSTNVFAQKPGRSEQSLNSEITKLIKSQSGAVVATTFASNVARLLTLAKSAKSAGRSVLVIGRAMQTMISTATSVGLLKDFPPTISVEDSLSIPRSNLFILATGSQGEGRAASAQLARDKYMNIVLEEGDCFLFSSKTIPGNELSVGKIINELMERGINVVDDQSDRYHVSGHANRPDLEVLHQIFNPKLIVPMHGEHRHMREHQRLVQSNGRYSIVVPNGSVLEIEPDGTGRIVDEINTGRIYLDGGQLGRSTDGLVKTRLQMASRGHISISLLLEKNIILNDGVWVKSKGLPENINGDDELDILLEKSLEMELTMLEDRVLYDDDLLENKMQRVVNKVCQKSIGKKPVTTIFINRVD
jgi:ribonuclease J